MSRRACKFCSDTDVFIVKGSNEDHRRGTFEIIRAIASILSRIPGRLMYTYLRVCERVRGGRFTVIRKRGELRAQWGKAIEPGEIWWRIPSPAAVHQLCVSPCFRPRGYISPSFPPHVHACIPYPITSCEGFESRRPRVFPSDPILSESKLFVQRARPMIGPISVHLFQGKRPIRIPRVMGR